MKRFILGFVFSENGNCVLIEKTKPDWQQGLVNGLGGSIEEGETPLEAMGREFKEESGLRAFDWQYALTIYGNDANKPVGSEWELIVFRGRIRFAPPLKQCNEGRVFYASSPPKNMEQTAHWLYWLCRDDSVFGLPMTNEQQPISRATGGRHER